MTNQRIRNLTTGKLHTKMEDICSDVEFIVGEQGIMTHQLPNAFLAMDGWLRAKLRDPRFWDTLYDPLHVGETDLQPMTTDERALFWARFMELPHPFGLIGAEP